MVVSPFPSILNWLFGVPGSYLIVIMHELVVFCTFHPVPLSKLGISTMNAATWPAPCAHDQWMRRLNHQQKTQRLEVKQDTRWNWSGINFTSSSVELQEVLLPNYPIQWWTRSSGNHQLLPSLTQVQQSGGLFAFASNLNHQGPEPFRWWGWFRQLDEVMREGWCCLMHRLKKNG